MPLDETMNFSAAVSVMMIQRKWRSKLRAHKLRRKKEWRRGRTTNVPKYTEIMEERGEAGRMLRQVGDMGEGGSCM